MILKATKTEPMMKKTIMTYPKGDGTKVNNENPKIQNDKAKTVKSINHIIMNFPFRQLDQ